MNRLDIYKKGKVTESIRATTKNFFLNSAVKTATVKSLMMKSLIPPPSLHCYYLPPFWFTLLMFLENATLVSSQSYTCCIVAVGSSVLPKIHQ